MPEETGYHAPIDIEHKPFHCEPIQRRTPEQISLVPWLIAVCLVVFCVAIAAAMGQHWIPDLVAYFRR